MYKIALVCQHGASTGLCVRKMIEAAEKLGIESSIAAYPDSQMDNLIEEMDCILLGPQLMFKKEQFKNEYPKYAGKIAVINTIDFGMMNGEKILKDAIALIESLK
ncbi:Phosphotransferase system lactose/cellobiose-specific IIB subunit [Tepidanaerobacter acetatoxydans Re1]|uniref:Phosphotransferase system lactose/cellobiose-specific IIB subunit n=1 Tax=Tepidanaerobacter acetatoxydans (strain DSM 21804 / JCM 16047 / Re1) TaxID=1209989 RepID=F4LSJ1_TEPAE|nr:PTS sugar transporter subunit IIB [Tepidanaerobacter acetatoxydans]AEE92381.1 phosphotransferase system lactose/cellobiose-specific IIB subunit [Tepidanaerobacter acetatoxydans Re1]CCP27276.1 Phosphotransferase system lactose/cellobiose-specific IIB subunit [Tepidanaerobacter acetatoxydans Re1]